MRLLLILIFITFNTFAEEKRLIGKSLLEYSIFKIDIYEIFLYQTQNGYQEIHLDYKIDVEKKHSLEGWKQSLSPLLKENPALKPKMEWILDQTVDYKSGDKIILRRNEFQVEILKNNQLLAKVDDRDVAKLILAPWIGKYPIDKKIKQELLSNEKK